MQLAPRPLSMCRSWAMATAVLAAGCGSSAASLCTAYCDCASCTDSALDSCIDTADKADDAASEAGCSSELSALVGCSESNAQCNGTLYTPGVCVTEVTNLTTCLVSGQCTISLGSSLYPSIECSK